MTVTLSQAGVAQKFHVSVSIGVAEVTTPSEVVAAFAAADDAAYASKEAGRARISNASAPAQ
jgi:PleD family two-component response regulator